MSSNRFSVPAVYAPDLDEDGDEPPSQHQCVACRALSPPTRGAHTSVSAQHGWRVVRTALTDGGFRYEWHCPACWIRVRRERVKPL